MRPRKSTEPLFNCAIDTTLTMNEERTAAEPAEEDGQRQFAAVAPLYDLLMHDVPYPAWIEYIRKLLEERNARPRHVLDLACGTGNVTELLHAEGYSMIGVDIAEDMIFEARRKASERILPIQYAVQDAAELDLPGRRFDLCVSLFDSLNYITDPARLQRAMERVGLHLTRQGLFLFDMNSEFALRNRFFDQSNRATDDRLRYDWESEYFPETRLCRVKMRFWYREDDGRETVFDEEHWQYAYREDEIVQMLEHAGFVEIAAYQAYTVKPAHRASDRIFYVARKA
jgi:ubiquinone/menaquinone biosynthesis C-methylase UbiE